MFQAKPPSTYQSPRKRTGGKRSGIAYPARESVRSSRASAQSCFDHTSPRPRERFSTTTWRSSGLAWIFGKSMYCSTAAVRRSIEKSERPRIGFCQRLGEMMRGSERNPRQARASCSTPPVAYAHALMTPIELATTPVRRIGRAVDGVLRHPERGRLLVATLAGRPIGLAALSFIWPLEHGGRSAWLEELYVEPPHRGRGIGRTLLRAACRLAARSA